ncbi:nucleolar complex protein 3 homolog isoform X2 [Varroa jacobsoni]|nr:nucleolar complex protein 3 homolog isoform X2 [Varroa jacobsoni]XP_022700239.1 nucleolar complex protein 3 homolog isoform X2 [Varroa jacobsoni]
MGISYKRKRIDDEEEVDLGVSSAEEDGVENFERTRHTFRRQNENLAKKKALLPTKHKGKLVYKEVDILPVIEAAITEAEGPEDVDSDEEEPSMTKVFDELISSTDEEDQLQGDEEVEDECKSEAERLAEQSVKVNEYMLQIGNVCSDIVENPEQHYRKINDLLQMTKMTGTAGYAIKKVALLSLGEVFADILPEYRVKEDAKPTANGPKLKKETRELMAYERTLLKLYKRFLVVCEDFVQLQYRAMRTQRQRKRVKRRKSKQFHDQYSDSKGNGEPDFEVPPHLLQLSRAAIQAFSRVFTARPYFNYRDKIAAIMVNSLVNRDSVISDASYNCLKTIYREDQLGETVFECVKHTKLLVKSYTAKLPPKVLYSLLNLRIAKAKSSEQEAIDLKEIRSKLSKMSRAEHRRHKDLQKLDRQLAEARAEDSEDRKSRVHTEILKQLMNIYFWILKKDDRPSQLLTPLLEGLSKYAHLLNIEFFDDLLDVLHRLMESEELTEGQTCHCLLTIFKILSGQGQVLNVDPTRFYTQLYATFLNLNACSPYDFTPTILQCLDLTLLKKKDASYQRLLGFTKRLLTVSLQAGDASTLSLLSMARALMTSHHQLDVLLDHEVGSGVFRPELTDPEHANASSAVLWECALLTKHYVPMVRRFAALVSEGSRGVPDKFVQNISKATPSQVYGAFRKRDAVEIADEVDKSKRSISTKPILWTQESSVSKGEAIIALLEDDIALWTHGEHLAPRYHNSL